MQEQPHPSGPDDAGRAFARDRKENGPRDVEFILPVGIDERDPRETLRKSDAHWKISRSA